MGNGHLVFEIICHFATRLIELIKKMDKDFQASTGLRRLHEMFHHVNAGENDALAGSREMGKAAMLNRIVL
jgi:hypothetical protein